MDGKISDGGLSLIKKKVQITTLLLTLIIETEWVQPDNIVSEDFLLDHNTMSCLCYAWTLKGIYDFFVSSINVMLTCKMLYCHV
jgi:hypothetical protein